MIVLDHLTKRFGEIVAVDRLSFQVDPGQIFGLLGPNGAGKTTTLRLLLGLLRPTTGTASVGGHDIVTSSLDVRRVSGFLPDTPYLYETMTGLEFIHFVADTYGVSLVSRKKTLPPLLERLGLAERAGSRISTYSFGMRKKVLLAAHLLHEPPILLLDEPTAGMDPVSVREIHDLLRECVARGAAVLLSTHLLDAAEKLCHRVGILDSGVLRRTGTPQEVGSNGDSLEEAYLEIFRGERDTEHDGQ